MRIFLALAILLLGCREKSEPQQRHSLPAGDPVAGRKVFVDMRCWSCHEIYGDDMPKPIANPPVPAYLGGNQIAAPDDLYLMTSIVNPSHALAEGWVNEWMTTTGGTSRMAEYGDVLTATQLFDLVSFLKTRYAAQTASSSTTQSPQ